MNCHENVYMTKDCFVELGCHFHRMREIFHGMGARISPRWHVENDIKNLGLNYDCANARFCTGKDPVEDLESNAKHAAMDLAQSWPPPGFFPEGAKTLTSKRQI